MQMEPHSSSGLALYGAWGPIYQGYDNTGAIAILQLIPRVELGKLRGK